MWLLSAFQLVKSVAGSWIVSVELKPLSLAWPNAARETELSELPEALAVALVMIGVRIAADRGLRTDQIEKAIRAIHAIGGAAGSDQLAALPEPVNAKASPPPEPRFARCST